MAKHKGARLYHIKRCLRIDYDKWRRNGWTEKDDSFDNAVEYLMQQGFVQGKQWLDYIDSLPEETLHDILMMQPPLCEGFIPPGTIIGRR